MKRLALVIALTFAVSACFAQQIGKQDNDWSGQSLTLNLSDPPRLVSTASAQRTTGNPGLRSLYYWIVTNTVAGSSTPAGPFTVQSAPDAFVQSYRIANTYINVPNNMIIDLGRANPFTVGASVKFFDLTGRPQLNGQTYTVGGSVDNGTYKGFYIAVSASGESQAVPESTGSVAQTSATVLGMVSIQWAPVLGAVSYDVLRTSTPNPPSGTCNCAVATGVTGTSAIDSSEALGAYTLVPLDPHRLTAQIANVSSGTGRSQLGYWQNGKFTPFARPSSSFMRYADQFSAPSVSAQIDAAIADCGSTACMVVVAPTMGLGQPSYVPDNVLIQDNRSAIYSGAYEDQGTHNGIMYRREIRSTRNGYDHYATLQATLDVIKGGHNSNESGGKNSYWSARFDTSSHTPGQMYGTYFKSYNYSSGDTISQFIESRRWGGTIASGDEGFKMLRLDGGGGDLLFTATVASVSGSTITYSSAVNADTLGETRPVTNRTPAKLHTATGCTVTLTVNPATVVCTGATLNDWFGASGPVVNNNICFELDSTSVDGKFNRIISLKSIESQTNFTLNWGSYAYAPNTGTGTFTRCTTATDVSVANQLTVADASVFASGDTIQEELGPEQSFQGVNVLYYPSQYPGFRTSAFSATNFGHTRSGTGSPIVPLWSFITTLGAYAGAPNTTNNMWDFYNGTILTSGISWHNESTVPPSSGWFNVSSDNTTGCETILTTADGARTGAASQVYCRDPTHSTWRGWRWRAGTNSMAFTDDGQLYVGNWNGENPNAGNQFQVTPNTGNDAITVRDGNALGASKKAFTVQDIRGAGYDQWFVDLTGNEFLRYGHATIWSSDNGTTKTAVVDGSTGAISSALGADNKAVCWKAASGGVRVLGYCSTQPDSAGSCTCN
jgi:hypothetical protein